MPEEPEFKLTHIRNFTTQVYVIVRRVFSDLIIIAFISKCLSITSQKRENVAAFSQTTSSHCALMVDSIRIVQSIRSMHLH